MSQESKELRAGAAHEEKHYADDLRQPEPEEEIFPPETEEQFPPELPPRNFDIKAAVRVVFDLGHRIVGQRTDLGRKLPRRNIVVSITDPVNIDQTIFRRVTSAASSWLSSVPGIGIKGVQTEDRKTSLRRQARNAAGRKRKIGL